jgi:uncharacterized protein (TIGR00730 family)
MKSISVFCGSSAGKKDVYEQVAYGTGQAIAREGMVTIYGGGNVGLMKAVADGALHSGGKVTGVLPRFLEKKELAHRGVTELILVDTMHERKQQMYERCDGIIALAGGFGTLEELFEMITWGQLGLHRKPIAVLNTEGFYDPLITLLQTMVDEGFLKVADQQRLIVESEIEPLLHRMRTFVPTTVGKWITKETI